ncbi:MAG TPA: helix-turn-helix domain-containing protein, partial [Candidatus Cloacimonas sp.]|nr:helix-turn-helix domain-containing protein [Candidatus Cloacimonas sp.]
PGNIRELRNFCKFIMINENRINNSIIKKHLSQKISHAHYSGDSNMERYMRIDNLKDSVASFERDYLLHHLQLNEWNVSQTAQSIGIERTTLYKKIKTLGINQSDMES